MKRMDNSKFHMWRGTIAVANLDNKITNEERDWLKDHLFQLPFDQVQAEIIEKDMSEPPSIDDILPQLTVPADRSMLLHFANIIFHADRDFSPEEKAFIDEQTEKIMSGLKIEKILEESKIKGVLESDDSNLKGGFGLLSKWFRD